MTLQAKNMVLAAALISSAPLFLSPAIAGGSVEIDQVMQLAGQSPELMQEINTELKASGNVLSQIVCDGSRLGRHWQHLGGLRIPPYTCPIGNRILELNATTTFFSDDASLPDGEKEHETARYVAIRAPVWSWK